MSTITLNFVTLFHQHKTLHHPIYQNTLKHELNYSTIAINKLLCHYYRQQQPFVVKALWDFSKLDIIQTIVRLHPFTVPLNGFLISF